MSTKTQLIYSVKNLFKRDTQGSYASQHDRHHMMLHFVNSLWELGYKIPKIYSLKPRHIEAVVKAWQSENISQGTLKNRMSVIRRLASLIHKPDMVQSNKKLEIENRIYIPSKNKALFDPD